MRSDPIADLLTRIRNASRAEHEKCDIPSSRLKVRIAELLKEEGFIKNFRVLEDRTQDLVIARGRDAEVLADRDLLGALQVAPGPLEVQDRAIARRKTHQVSIVVAGGTKSKHFGAETARRRRQKRLSRRSDSNRRPADYKSAALPAELLRRRVKG